MATLEIEPGWSLSPEFVTYKFVRSAGPGGQNVNKVSTKVELRFAVQACDNLSQAQKERLARAFPSVHTSTGYVVITSDEHRSQLMNRKAVLERLFAMLRQIRRPPKRRVKTAPTQASQRRRVDTKRKRSETKRQRRLAE
jgi:ribosome-associated protein